MMGILHFLLRELNMHLFNIGASFTLLGFLLILGHIQVKDICKQRLARDGQTHTNTYKVRKYALLFAQLSSFISCFYIILNCYGLLNYRELVDYTMLYKRSTDIMILISEYLTIIRLHKYIVDRTTKPRASVNYDIAIAVVYGISALFVVHTLT
mgnify:CR=1 FL=1